MSKRIAFNDNWLFFDGEIETPQAPDKGPSYCQAKTEHYLAGPASIHFPDAVDHFLTPGMKAEINLRKTQSVTLPHDYIITQVPEEKRNKAWGFFDYHPAWYRKHFIIDEKDKDKRVVLYFEGVADHATVYFNGVYMYDNYEAHTPFEIDLTDFIRFGEDNVIAVHVECGTGEGWWYQGGGIYRNVWLEYNDPVSVARYGVYVHPDKKSGKNWNTPVETEIRNDNYRDVTVKVNTKLVAEDGAVIGEAEEKIEVPARSIGSVSQNILVKAPALWDIDTPVLYKAVTTLTVGRRVTDVQETSYGYREISYSPETGFYLNGRNVKLQGVCGHGDYGLTGLAVPESVFRYKAQLIKDMGANAYRCSHYAQAEYWMDEMDRRGIVVMDETRWFSSAPAALNDLRILMKRDRNHPSIIMWSIGNEEPFFITEQGARISRALYAEANKLDKTRPILTANDKDPEVATVYQYSDIVGVNYHMELFDKLHSMYPEKPILSTENTATGTSRGWYHDNVSSLGRISSFDHDTNAWFLSREKTWQYILDRSWLMGGMQWIAFEHRGEAEWPRLCSVSGAIDLYLQKKDAFYQNQSFWLDRPMIHVLPHWNHPGMEGKKIPVWAYTNCEEAELFVNGRSAGRVSIQPVQHAEWNVTYRPGTIEVVGYNNGEIVCRDVQETTGLPVSLKLIPENAGDVKPGDVLLLTCVALDEEGREVPDAAIDRILFYSDGGSAVIGTGSDHTDHVPPRMNARSMYAGRVSVAVKTGEKGGKIRVYAESAGLASGVIELTVK